MSGQNKIKVSSEINETFNDISCDGAANCTPSQSGNNNINPEIMDHAYALISLAKQNGLEPFELLARVLNSGNLVLSQNQNYIQPEIQSNNINFSEDTTDIACFEDDLKDWGI